MTTSSPSAMPIMTRARVRRNSTRGFTLIEMAVVMVIIGLLLGGLLTPLATQMENDRRKETQTTLIAIRDALIGYAQINGKLPCPDNNNNGLADDVCTPGVANLNPPATPGRLPYATLGVSPTDSWGNRWNYVVNGGFTVAAPTLTKTTAGSGNGLIQVSATTGCAAPLLADNVPALIWSGGKSALPGALETENANGDRCFTDAGYSMGNPGFDDMLVWIPRGLLINRMVAAGSL